MGMKETGKVPFDSMPPLIRGLFLTKEQAKKLKEPFKDVVSVVRCKDCKYGSLYCTEDVCGETLIECTRPDLGDVIELHGWKWFCADGERKGE